MMIEKATAFPVTNEDLIFRANVNSTLLLFSTKKKISTLFHLGKHMYEQKQDFKGKSGHQLISVFKLLNLL